MMPGGEVLRESHLPERTLFALSEIERPFLARFDLRVRQFPAKTAIVQGERQISYQELDARANRLAHLLLEDPHRKPVGILMGHDVESITSVLAVIKSGRPFVPLDMLHPLKRLREIVEDAGIGALLCSPGQNDTGQELVALTKCRLLQSSPDRISESPAIENDPFAPACIVYTSGTTGSPKGICHSRRGLLHSVMRSTNSLQITPDDRWLLLVNTAHMGGINGILRVLLNGATLYLYSLFQNSLTALGNYLNDQGVTIFHAVPTVYRLFVKSQARRVELHALRLFLIGGEALSADDVKRFQANFKAPCRLVNHLGCTEFSGYAEYVIDQTTSFDGGLVPVGFATEGAELVIVDDGGRPVEPGQVGNIEIRSEYLATCYWRDPDLTRARFSEATPDRKRSYRPGDIGKMRPDGCLVFLGREDAQVHIRGNRVELIEIEQALRTCSEIDDARVAAFRLSNNELILTAYATLNDGTAADASEIKRRIGQTLPDYMIPHNIVFIKEFPLNANGKVDLKLLQTA